MSRPFPSRSSWSGAPQVRVNGKIRAREVRVIGADGQQLGVPGRVIIRLGTVGDLRDCAVPIAVNDHRADRYVARL